MPFKNLSVIALIVGALSLAISVQPFSKIFPALLNELMYAAIWMALCIVLIWRKRKIEMVNQLAWAPLSAFGLMIILLVVQYSTQHSVSYFGIVLTEIFSLLMASTVLCVGANVGLLSRAQSRSSNVKGVRLAAMIVVAVALIQAVFGWLQYLELHLYFNFISLLNVGGRAFGNVRQFNLFALLLLLGLIGCAYLISTNHIDDKKLADLSQAQKNDIQIHDTLILFMGVVICGALVASASRFGMIGLFVLAALGLFNFKSSKKSAVFLCFLPIAYISFYLFFVWLDAREYLPFYGTQRAISYKVVSAENNQDRIEIWKSSFQLIQQYPWFGVGFGMLAIRSGLETTIGRLDVYIDYAHNLPLQWALEFGLPAMLVLLGLLAFTLWQLRAMLMNHEGRLLATFLGLPLLHEMVEFPLHYLLFLLPWCFALGYCLAVYRTNSNKYLSHASNYASPNSKKIVTRWVVLPFLLLVASLFAVQDAKKAAILYEPVGQDGVENAIKKTYSTVAFQNVVDYAMVQIVPVTKYNASNMHRLVAAASQLKFDYLMAAIYIRAAALDNKLCTAKSIVYRVNNADSKSKQIIFEQIRKWEEPVFRDLENYLKTPYFIPWSKSLPDNC